MISMDSIISSIILACTHITIKHGDREPTIGSGRKGNKSLHALLKIKKKNYLCLRIEVYVDEM